MTEPATTETIPFPADEDALRMARLAAGEEKALVELIERWKQPLVGYLAKSIGNHADAEDLAQVVFIRIYRAAPHYRPTAKFSTYLFHIARRLLINEYRRRQRKPSESCDPAELHAVDLPDSGRAVSEIEEAFQQALEALPEKHRSALLLFKQQELSYEQIAAILNATESAVKTWIFRARQALKLSLKDFV